MLSQSHRQARASHTSRMTFVLSLSFSRVISDGRPFAAGEARRHVVNRPLLLPIRIVPVLRHDGEAQKHQANSTKSGPVMKSSQWSKWQIVWPVLTGQPAFSRPSPRKRPLFPRKFAHGRGRNNSAARTRSCYALQLNFNAIRALAMDAVHKLIGAIPAHRWGWPT